MPGQVEEHRIRCPWCNEAQSLLVDTSAGDQAYIEDCQVCCRPMSVTLTCDDGELLALDVSGDR